ncbi:polysulfide reductase NrfD [Campylobacter sp. 2018MI01]|uniref:NrfD/PsrC family molybdoenzyme membrane anchor subunit n=1 Tax=Campylobacter sp. 2018MI01 TaxID=2836735 RepID=UPI001BD98CBA|nr:NrfD/PsrC family molybdoenzyme membrane anchor subunit [Campylobacter sp. 2018MI01]MBT0878053.1 polysulfide reductase NrfD [Campylobacter sp. 2018MI01]
MENKMSAVVLEGFSVQRTWALDVVNDFFIAGASFGAFLCASLYLVFGLKNYKNIALFSMIISFVCLCAIPFNLIDDLKQPSRVFEIFLNGWGNLSTSAMKIGIILLITYPILLILLAYNHINNKNTKKLGIITLIVSFCIPLYTGYILGTSVGVSFWNTPVLPLLFAANGGVGGVGICALVLFIYSKIINYKINLFIFIRLASALIVCDLLLRLFWFSFMLGFNKEIKELYQYVFMARFYEIFILEFCLIFIILINLFTRLKNNQFFLLLAFLSMIIYSFSFKFNVVFAGNSMPKIMSGFLTYTPKTLGSDSLGSVFGNWLICISLFCLLVSILEKQIKGELSE